MVVSKQGAGRAGCFCAVSIAYDLLTGTGEKHIPEQWKQDSNILDQVSAWVGWRVIRWFELVVIISESLGKFPRLIYFLTVLNRIFTE